MQHALLSCRPPLPRTCWSLVCGRTSCTRASFASFRHFVVLLDLYHSPRSALVASRRLASRLNDSSNHSCRGDDAGATVHSPVCALDALPNAAASERGGGASEFMQVEMSSASSSPPSQNEHPGSASEEAPSTSSDQCPTRGPLRGFSQGLTDFCWREDDAHRGTFEPSVLHGESLKNRIRLFGMAKGYPDTTAVGFRRFFYLSQANSFIADFSACIGYQSLLSGFFLGSSPQMWMLKDLFPALIAAYMANRLVSYEGRPKLWFCVSVLLRNVTIISDMVIPSAVPNHMVLAAIVNAVLKQSSALMFFITRAAALQHYAINKNLAELTKKFNSFSMVTFTLATALAIVYCTFFTSFAAQLTTILVCCVANVTLSYMAMSPIAFRILQFGTMQVLLHAYMRDSTRVMTPQDVSDLMGIRMSPASAMEGDSAAARMATHLLYISPPVDRLLIRSDTMGEDVLYLHSKGAFLLAMWRPSAVPLTLRESWRRYELPSLPRFLREGWWRRRSHTLAEVEKRFEGRRLCLLVQHQCCPKDLITAYLIMYTAVLQNAATEEGLRAFVRQCNAEQEVWAKKGEVLFNQLREANWDVDLPALDHLDFRVSDLPVERPTTHSKATTASSGSASDMGV